MFKWLKKIFSIHTESKEECRNYGASKVQLGNHLFNSNGRLHIEMKNGEYLVNGKPLVDGLPEGVTLDIVD
jgi:hypothetical protein